jgi:hypothetical protein
MLGRRRVNELARITRSLLGPANVVVRFSSVATWRSTKDVLGESSLYPLRQRDRARPRRRMPPGPELRRRVRAARERDKRAIGLGAKSLSRRRRERPPGELLSRAVACGRGTVASRVIEELFGTHAVFRTLLASA